MEAIKPHPSATQPQSAMQERIKSTLRVASIAQWTRELNGSFSELQLSWSELTGQKQEELNGFGWLSVVHPDDYERVRSYWANESQAAVLCYRLLDKSGVWREVEERIARFDGSDGLPPQAIGIIEDVGTLRRAQQRLRQALDGGKIGTWDVDLFTGTMTCSSQCKANYGRRADQSFSYHDLAMSVHPSDIHRWKLVVGKAIESRGQLEIEYRTVWPDASIHWVHVRGGCELDDTGLVSKLSGVSIDITDRKLAQHLEKELALTIAEENKKKSEFLAILGHELRGPLGPILGALHLLRTQGESLRNKDSIISLAERQAKHMKVLVGDLLDLSRIERGEIYLNLELIDLREPIKLAVESCMLLIESRGQSFFRSGFDVPLLVIADPTRVTQMISNLLNNASKYTAVKGQINLDLCQRGKFAEIAVTDNGVGLDPSSFSRVFQMFEQVENQKVHAQGGLGIGLALTKKLVDLHQGSIFVSSEGIGHGCTFTVSIPATE